MIDCCQQCADDIKKAPLLVGRCDWCKTNNIELHNHRDYEEGMCGPVYTICQPCIKRYNESVMSEIVDDEPLFDDYYNVDHLV